ncbi:hypothetical protein Droror1_Dr00008515 [Drosera rotundifolia]
MAASGGLVRRLKVQEIDLEKSGLIGRESKARDWTAERSHDDAGELRRNKAKVAQCLRQGAHTGQLAVMMIVHPHGFENRRGE